jgi:hypothetical protein
VATPNAETMADMALCAAEVGDDTLPVGAADFFAALLVVRVGVGPVSDRPSGPDRSETGPTFRQRPSDCMDTVKPTPALDPASPTLLVCGSAASWAQRAAAATAQGIPAFALPHDVGAIVAALQASRRALVGIGDGPATRRLDSSQLVQRLAESVAATVRATPPARLLLEGGATAAAVTRALGWTRLRACEIFPPGVGVLRPAEAAGPLLFIKPGSYAWPPEVWPGLSP